MVQLALALVLGRARVALTASRGRDRCSSEWGTVACVAARAQPRLGTPERGSGVLCVSLSHACMTYRIMYAVAAPGVWRARYSVVYTDRAQNLMSSPFCEAMRDISTAMKKV